MTLCGARIRVGAGAGGGGASRIFRTAAQGRNQRRSQCAETRYLRCRAGPWSTPPAAKRVSFRFSRHAPRRGPTPHEKSSRNGAKWIDRSTLCRTAKPHFVRSLLLPANPPAISGLLAKPPGGFALGPHERKADDGALQHGRSDLGKGQFEGEKCGLANCRNHDHCLRHGLVALAKM